MDEKDILKLEEAIRYFYDTLSDLGFDDHAFATIVIPFGSVHSIAYFSNAEREDMLVVIKDFVRYMEESGVMDEKGYTH